MKYGTHRFRKWDMERYYICEECGLITYNAGTTETLHISAFCGFGLDSKICNGVPIKKEAHEITCKEYIIASIIK